MVQWWAVLGGLAAVCACVKYADGSLTRGFKVDAGSAAASLRKRYLCVFWLVKLCDWMQGPYFYEVYASKTSADGTPISGAVISSLFVTGFASSLVFGTVISSVTDTTGRKKAVIICAVFFILSCLSVHASSMPLLYAGRLAGGIASSLMHSAFESWLCTAAEALAISPKLRAQWTDEVFTIQTFGDGLVAVVAGVVANQVTGYAGTPVAVFNVAAVVGVSVAAACTLLWTENYGSGASGAPSLGDLAAAGRALMEDQAVLLQGLIQSFFEAAMFCFVLLWVPTLKAASYADGSGDVPTGILFSCLMVCIMIGSSAYGMFRSSGVATEDIAWVLIAIAFLALLAPVLSNTLVVTACAWFLFEMCVGVSFPTFGTIRANILPPDCRSALLAVYRVPLNVLVVAILLNSERMGTKWSLMCCCALLVASFAMQGVLRPMLKRRALEKGGKKQ